MKPGAEPFYPCLSVGPYCGALLRGRYCGALIVSGLCGGAMNPYNGVSHFVGFCLILLKQR